MPPLKGAFSSPGGEGHGHRYAVRAARPRGVAQQPVLALEAHDELAVRQEGEGFRVARVLALRRLSVGSEERAHLDVLDALEEPVAVHEPRGDPRALVGDRGEPLAVGQDPKRRDAAETRVVRDEVQAAAVLQAAHDVLPRVLGVERDARRAHGHGLGGDEGGQDDGGRQETPEESTVQHDGRGG